MPLPLVLDSWSENDNAHIPDYFERFLHDRHRKMGPIINQPRYIVFWHLWKLLLEDTFESSQDDQAFSSIVIVDYSKLDFSVTLFLDSWLNFM